MWVKKAVFREQFKNFSIVNARHLYVKFKNILNNFLKIEKIVQRKIVCSGD